MLTSTFTQYTCQHHCSSVCCPLKTHYKAVQSFHLPSHALLSSARVVFPREQHYMFYRSSHVLAFYEKSVLVISLTFASLSLYLSPLSFSPAPLCSQSRTDIISHCLLPCRPWLEAQSVFHVSCFVYLRGKMCLCWSDVTMCLWLFTLLTSGCLSKLCVNIKGGTALHIKLLLS